jgi:transcription elongation factor Elf1
LNALKSAASFFKAKTHNAEVEPKAYCPRCQKVTPHVPVGFDPENKAHVAKCRVCGAFHVFQEWVE